MVRTRFSRFVCCYFDGLPRIYLKTELPFQLSKNYKARWLRLNAGLPKNFWTEAVTYACFNLSPTNLHL